VQLRACGIGGQHSFSSPSSVGLLYAASSSFPIPFGGNAKKHAIERTRCKAERRAAKQISDPEKNATPVVLDPLTVDVTLLDMNPLKPIWSILKRKNNLFILLPSCECLCPQPSPLGLTRIHSTAIRFPVQYMFHYVSHVLSCPVQFQSSSSRSRLTLLWFGYVVPRERRDVSSTYSTGNMFGSVLGGKWSDYNLAKLKQENGGKSAPEVNSRFNSS